jgi:hypothetical protein
MKVRKKPEQAGRRAGKDTIRSNRKENADSPWKKSGQGRHRAVVTRATVRSTWKG